MNVNRVITVREGEALSALRQFLAGWWKSYALDALLAPVEAAGQPAVTMQAVEDPAGLAAVNPWAPVMLSNAAAALGEFAERRPGRRLAAVLHPCEIRTIVELRRQGRLPAAAGSVVIIGLDCPGTFPAELYAERVQAQGSVAVLREALAYADEGGFSPQDYRTACQVCAWPAPRGADLTIGVFGTQAGSEHLVLIAHDEESDARLKLGAAAPALATEAQVARREVAVGAVAEQRAKARARLVGAVSPGPRFADLGSLLSLFASCSLCGDCLDACPLYNGELSGMLGVHGARPPLAEMVDVGRWLAACAGCGMCESSCDQDVPLMLLIASLSQQIQGATHQRAGEPARPLPWASG